MRLLINEKLRDVSFVDTLACVVGSDLPSEAARAVLVTSLVKNVTTVFVHLLQLDCINLGVDMLFTDKPDILSQTLERLREEKG